MKRVVFLLAAVAACVLCLCAFGSKVKVFSDNFDRPERFARYWNHNAGEVPGTVEYLPEGGADGSGCVKIASAEKTALAIKHKLTGLHPGKLYRLSALMKCDSVQDGRGAVLYLDPEGLEQSWNASEFAYGTNDWTEVYLDFVPDRQGEAVVCCGLGFPWGTYNGGKASGTVWYDNVKVTPGARGGPLYPRGRTHRAETRPRQGDRLRCRHRRLALEARPHVRGLPRPGGRRALRRAQNHDPQHAGHRTRLLGAGRQPDPVEQPRRRVEAARPHGRVRRLGLRHHPRDRPCLLAGKHFGYGTLELERRDFRQFPHVLCPRSVRRVRCRSATSATGVPM